MLDYEAILTAVFDFWAGSADLNSILPATDVEIGKSTKSTTPRGVLMPVGNTPDYHLGSSPKSIESIMFDIVLYDDSRSSIQIVRINKELANALDNAQPTFVNGEYSSILLDRQNTFGPDRDDRLWRMVTTYEGMFQES